MSKTMINTSGLEPRGSAVLVEPYQPEIKKGLIYIPPPVEEKNKMIEMRAIVIEVGPEAWKDESEHRANAGDEVLIVNYAGRMVNGVNDGKLYRMINANDIYCRVKRNDQEFKHG